MNLYAPWKRKGQKATGNATDAKAGEDTADDRRLLRTSRWFQIIVTLAGVAIAPFIMFFRGGFYAYIQKASSFFSIPVFTILAVGLVTRKVPPIAAKMGLVFFVTVYALSQFVFTTGMHYLHISFILFIATALLMLLIGKIRPMSSPYHRRMTAVVNIQPWKNRHWYSAALIILMITLFALFSPLGLVK
jgi:SSS family solute:Na+ symporter